MFYITGDKHGRFANIKVFCEEMNTTKDDILIILGDAGINFDGLFKDESKKKYLEELPITIFSIHGNHEQRPQTIFTYKEKKWKNGIVYYEEEYPSLLFGKDGEIYDFDGKQVIVIGGAFSVDWYQRVIWNMEWWKDEQPSDEIKKYVEKQLNEHHWKVDIVLSHTTPLKYEPIEAFLPGIDQSRVDKSTEEWLDKIEDKCEYKKWYCGHYHIEKKIDKVEFMFQNFDELKI